MNYNILSLPIISCAQKTDSSGSGGEGGGVCVSASCRLKKTFNRSASVGRERERAA